MNDIDQELIDAARDNNQPEVRRLLSVGADIEAKDNDGRTPLQWASLRGHVQVVQALVEHGTDIEAKDNFCWTPLHWACLKGRVAVFIELLGHAVDTDTNKDNNGAPTSILGKRKSHGADIEAKDGVGDTPLHLACSWGHLAIVKALLAVGANILAATIHGRLPIDCAVIGKHSEVAKCLLQHFYATIHGSLSLFTNSWKT
jgi:ankyrin repeat protein